MILKDHHGVTSSLVGSSVPQKVIVLSSNEMIAITFRASLGLIMRVQYRYQIKTERFSMMVNLLRLLS